MTLYGFVVAVTTVGWVCVLAAITWHDVRRQQQKRGKR